MAVFEPESLNLLPDREILHCVCYKDWKILFWQAD